MDAQTREAERQARVQQDLAHKEAIGMSLTPDIEQYSEQRLSPDMLEEFSSVYIKEIVEELQDDHFAIIYHNCGPSVTSCVDEILSSGCAAYHFGNAIDILDILENVKMAHKKRFEKM